MIVQTLMNSVHPKRNHVLGLLRLAPDFNLESLSDPSMLIKYGIWSEIKGWEELQKMPRYFAGRDIIVKATVNPFVGNQHYMMYDPSQETYSTHNAKLVGREGSDFIV